MEVRKCCGCGKTHPLTKEFFHASRKEKSGYGYCCKVCVNTKNKEKKLAERLNSEKYKVKMQEAATGLRECKTCGVEKELTLFQASSYTTVDGTCKTARKRVCNICRQVERNGGRPSKPKVGASQTLVKVKGKTYKQCSTCQESKKLEAFNKDRNALTGYAHYCRNCANERKKKDYATRPETRIVKRAWDAKNKAKVRAQEKIRHQRYYAKPEVKARREEWYRKWVLRNPEKIETASKKRAGEITDAYVEHLLCSGGGGKRIPKAQWPEIPQELIEVKRMHLKLLRAIKEKG